MCAYTLAFIDDMSQQLENKNLLSINAFYNCESCLIHKNQRENLEFDVIRFERYYHFIMTFCRKDKLFALFKQKEYYKQFEMSITQNSLIKIA